VIEPLLTAQQLSAVLGLTPGTILDRFEAGDLPGFRLFAGTDKRGRPTGAVRFRESEIAAWIEGQRTVAVCETPCGGA
jgi:Helix-turn-helix domain